MDSFSILCTTCKTRLKVRDESAVGKILACPKCGGMVMVKPPAQWEAAADEQGSTRTAIPNSASGTQPMTLLSDPAAFDDVEDLLAGRAPPAQTSAPVAPAPPVARQAPPVKPQVPLTAPSGAPKAEAHAPPSGPATTAPGTIAAATAPTAPAAAPLSQTPTEDLPMRPDWEANRPWRYWFSLSCAGLGGTLLALVVVMVTIRWFQQRPTVAIAPPIPTVTPVSDSAPPPAEPAPEPDEPGPSAPQRAEPTTPTEPASDVPSSDQPSSEPPKQAPLPASPAPPEAPMALAPEPKATPKNDPLETLDKVGKLLGEPKIEEEPKLDDKSAPIPVDSDPSPTPTPAALPRPEPRTIDVAARLADKLPEIKADGVPLAEFLQFMLEFSTVPITLEPESLIWVRATPVTPVNLHLANNSVGDVLKAALAPLKLEPQIAEDQIVVTLPARLVTITYPVGDLTSDDPSQIAGLIETVREAIDPESWKGDGGPALTEKKNALEVKHVPSIQLQVLMLMEKLRVARGLATRSKFDPAQFRIVSRYERALSKLEQPISCNFSQPTSLVRILEQLSETAAVEILVDWRSLLSEGWTPDTVGTLVISKQPLERALTSLLKPMDLAVRVVDERTVQVVSTRDLDERVDLELFPAGDLLEKGDAEHLLTQIRSTLGDEHFRDSGGKGSLAFDASSKHLIAVLPQPQQRALYALLHQWRMERK